jgi:FKBP-type peptidyl-prolyl cis-trans isomerase
MSPIRTLIAAALVVAPFALATPVFAAKAAVPAMPKTDTVDGLTKIDTVVGKGAAVASGQQIQVHYTGWLYDPKADNSRGRKFDSSVDRGQTFGLVLGGGMVIKGWDEGIVGMKEGGKRTLVIPPEYGYGARGAGGVIPGNATLVFDVELVKIVSP